MTINQLIDAMLIAHQSKGHGICFFEVFEKNGFSAHYDPCVIQTIMVEEGLIMVNQTTARTHMLSQGDAVIRMGGWFQYLQKEKKYQLEPETTPTTGIYGSKILTRLVFWIIVTSILWSVVYFWLA